MQNSLRVLRTACALLWVIPGVGLAADCLDGEVIGVSSSCTVPAGITRVLIQTWGGGGSGGGYYHAGGGGGGSYCGGVLNAVQGDVIDLTIGAGGVQSNVDGSGFSGASTAVTVNGTPFLAAPGGGGGSSGNLLGGTGGLAGAACAGGSLTGFAGGAGGTGVELDVGMDSFSRGGGGGGSALANLAGGNGTSPTYDAATVPGGAGQGNGGMGGINTRYDPGGGVSQAPGAGLSPGGGGGGATDSGTRGSAGAAGQAILRFLQAPQASSVAATSIQVNGATVNAMVDDRGGDTTVVFAYGLSTAYGSTVSATGGPLPAGSGSSALSASVSGLSCNTSYHFRVEATNGTGSVQGNDLTFVTDACVPGAPTSVSATAGAGQASIAFAPPASNGGAAISSYTATSNPGGFTATGAGSPLIVSGLANGTTYTFTVSASNAAGPSIASDASNSVTPGQSAGSCGAAQGVASAFAPTVNLCLAGTASTVLSSSPWSWSCQGSFGGASSACTAPNAAVSGADNARAIVSGGTWTVDGAQSGGFIAATGSASSPPNLPANYSFPFGLFDVRLTGGAPGTTATVTLTYTQTLPAGMVYMKYGRTLAQPAAHWFAYPGAIFAGNTITLPLTDGGAGDDDLTADGNITDPGGPALLGAGATAIPTLSQWGVLLIAGLLALFGGLHLRRRQHAGDTPQHQG